MLSTRRFVTQVVLFYLLSQLLSAQSVPTVIAGGFSKATYIGSAASPLTTSIAPSRIAIAPNGDIYFLDQDGFLLKLNAGGRLSVVASGLAVPESPAGGIAADGAGNVFFADTRNQTVLRIDARGGLTTFAGTPGSSGFSGDGGPAANARLASPSDIALDAAGNLYIADSRNNRIRRVAPGGTITTFATANSVSRIAVDPTGGLYIISSGGLNRVETNGLVTRYSTVVTASLLLAVDNQGRVYTTNSFVSGHAIVRISPTATTIVAGSTTAGFSGDGGQATSARLNFPGGFAFDASNNMIIADAGNFRIRRIDQNNVIRTIAGSGLRNYFGDDGPATAAALSRAGIAFDSSGNLFIGDWDNWRIRKVDVTGKISTFYDGGSPLSVSRDIVAVHPSGGVLFICSGGAICRSSADGKSATRLVGGGTATPADNVPADSVAMAIYTFAVDRDGNIFIGGGYGLGTYALFRVDSRNMLTFVERFPEVSPLRAVAVNPDGNFVTARGFVISTYSPAGKLISRRTMPPAGRSVIGNQVVDFPVQTFAVAEDAKGNVYLAQSCDAFCYGSPQSSMVYKFTRDGNLAEYYSSGVFGDPAGIAISGNRLFVADQGREVIFAAPLFDGPVLNSTRVLNGASVQPGPIASDELLRLSGINLATATASRPQPQESIDGASVTVKDAAGASAPMKLYSVSPGLIVGVVPPGMKAGAGKLIVENALGKSNEVPVDIAPTAPGLHSINASGSGPAFATLDITSADGGTISRPAYSCSSPANCVTVPLYSGGDDATSILTFQATGMRNYADASFRLGPFDAEIVDIRPDENQPGFDLVHVRVPPAFAESGHLDAVMTVDGVRSNAVQVAFGNPARFELTLTPGFSGAFSGSPGLNDVPHFVIRNLSSRADLTRLVFTIGDTSRSFHRLIADSLPSGNTSVGVSRTVVSPDLRDPNARSDKLEIQFGGLSPGKTWGAQVELDAGPAETVEDFTKVFFNNGDAPNSTVLAEFSDGRVVTFPLPDGTVEGDKYAFTQTQPGGNAAGYDLSIGPGGSGTDTPRFILTNRSDVADITRLKFTVGDTQKNFDGASFLLSQSSAGVRGTTLMPDEGNDGIRSDYFEIAFTGLGPGKMASMATDLDDDRGNTVEDFVRTFFNNGDAPNSVVEVTFSDGRVLSMTLPDGEAAGNLFVFSQDDRPQAPTAPAPIR